MSTLRPVGLLLWACPLFALLANRADAVVHARAGRQDPSSDPYSQVTSQVVVADTEAASSTKVDAQSKKYLLASFPQMRQVAYVHLPDNVWRPLVIGDVMEPAGVAVDTENARLFVADLGRKVIWWYQLTTSSDGLLQTDGEQHAAVEGVLPNWLTVNTVGDLYFTGKLTSSTSNYSSVFRQDAMNIAKGTSTTCTELFTRSNTGTPDPKVWVPSGIAVDSLFVYWGNEEDATTHGAVVKASRTNIGLLSADKQLKSLSNSVDQVRGMTATGSHIFYLSPLGVHGVLKAVASPVAQQRVGLVAVSPTGNPDPISGSSTDWNPTSIAWDGDNMLYFTETTRGIVYTVPAANTYQHNLTKFVDAPGVHGMALIAFTSGGLRSSAAPLPCLALLLAALCWLTAAR